jgi:hypothetical protein
MAHGYRPFVFERIENGRPKFELSAPESLYVGRPGYIMRVVSRDHRGTQRRAAEDVPVTIASLDGGVGASSVTIAARTSVRDSIPLMATAPGLLRLEARDPRTGTFTYEPDTVVIRALLPPVSIGPSAQIVIGSGQRTVVDLMRPEGVTGDASVAVARRGSSTTSDAAATIPHGQRDAPYRIVGGSIGVDTLTASAPGYESRSVRVVVTEGRIGFLYDTPPTLRIGRTFGQVVIATDSLGTEHSVDAATTFQLSGDGVTFSSGGKPITSITIAAGASRAPAFQVVGERAGPASFEITNLAYRTARMQVTVVP